jgi:putative peptidoglycan lipid II flippase
VQLLFQHGAFTPEDASATAQVLVFLALALPAHVLTKALAPSFFAREDTATPLKASLIGLGIAILAAFLFNRLWGASGLAGGIALGAWSAAIALIHHGMASFGFALQGATHRRLWRIAVAALAMAGLLQLLAYWTTPHAPAHGLAQAVALALTIAAGIAIYLLLLAAFGIIGWRDAVNAMRPARTRSLRS